MVGCLPLVFKLMTCNLRQLYGFYMFFGSVSWNMLQ